jgi:hypothetical protein
MAPRKKAAAPPPVEEKSSSKTFALQLTTKELEHLRNLFSIILPSEEEETVSSMLAGLSSKNTKFESVLWQKIGKLCEQAGVETGEGAPDFVIGTMAGVYQVEYGDE